MKREPDNLDSKLLVN